MLFGLAFDNQLKQQPPKIYPNIPLYNGYISREILSLLHRYQYQPVRPTPGIMLLYQVINSLPIQEMMKTKDQYKRFLLLEEHGVKEAGRILDPAFQNESGVKPSFCGTENHPCPTQFVLPTTCKDPLVDLPMGREWQAWKLMKPFRIGMIDTQSLSFHAYLDVLLYRKTLPKFAVYTLNIPMLTLMYTVYLDSINNEVKDDTLVQFLHTSVVYPSLLADNANLWLRGCYLRVLKAHLQTDQHVMERGFEDAIWEQANNGRIGSEYPMYIEEITKLTDLFIRRNIYPDVYLSSCLLLNDINVLQYFKSYQQMNEVPYLRQYNWIEYLRDSDWIEFFTLVLSYNKHWTEYSYFKSYLNRCLRLFQESRSWTDCHNEYIQHYIQYHIHNQLNRINMEDVK